MAQGTVKWLQRRKGIGFIRIGEHVVRLGNLLESRFG